MGLFTPLWMKDSLSPKQQEKALKKMEQMSAEELETVFRKSPNHFLRAAAIGDPKITDPALIRTAAGDPIDPVRLAAIRKLTSPVDLASIAENDKNCSLRSEAVSRLKDPEIRSSITRGEQEKLVSILVKTENIDLADALRDRIHGTAYCVHLAKTGKLAEVRCYFARLITDSKAIRFVLLHTDDRQVADILMQKLEGQSSYLMLAQDASSKTVRQQAAALITDEAVLAQLIVSDPGVFLSFLDRIREEKTLEWIEQNTDSDPLLQQVRKKQGIYVCTNCGEKSPAISCLCRFCGAENHQYEHIRQVTEYRDYEAGAVWDECVRCGKKINYRSIYTM